MSIYYSDDVHVGTVVHGYSEHTDTELLIKTKSHSSDMADDAHHEFRGVCPWSVVIAMFYCMCTNWFLLWSSVTEMSSDSEELMFGSQNFHSSKKLCKFTTLPSKNDITEKTEGDDDYQSSYGGSCHSDSEISGICESDEEKEEK